MTSKTESTTTAETTTAEAKAAGEGDVTTSIDPRQPGLSAGMVLDLQRMAGNRAVTELLNRTDPVPVQRLSVKSTDIADALGDRSKRMGLIGRSTFAAITTALGDYENATGPKEKARYLRRLDNLCSKWFDQHGQSQEPLDVSRRAFVTKLLDEVPAERLALSKGQAGDIYLRNIEQAGAEGTKDKFALKALRQGGRTAAMSGLSTTGPGALSKEGQKLAEEKGLSPAEIAAIRVFSAADYSYINAATSQDPQRMVDAKARKSAVQVSGETPLSQMDDETLNEEGSLHSGMAMEGLRKLEPYTDTTYRGARFTQSEFDKEFGSGIATFNSFASTTVKEDVALAFEHGVGTETLIEDAKDIAVLYVFLNPDGRDIANLSAVKREGEVLILPGSRYAVMGKKEVDGHTVYKEYLEKLKGAPVKQPLPRKWFVIELAPVPKTKAPEPPAAGESIEKDEELASSQEGG